MSQVAIIGCGVIGAAIAYELSLVAGLQVTVLDCQSPAQGATSAALGVMMGAISKKAKGRAWQLRQATMQRYETLIPELEAITGRQIPFNRNGILMLCLAGEDLAPWERLVKIRESQGWQLEIWDTAQIQSRCPQLDCHSITAAVYSPQDRQVDPTTLTQALVAAAKSNGVTFHFGATIKGVESMPSTSSDSATCCQIHTDAGKLEVDWLVIAAGLGSTQLATLFPAPEIGNTSPLILKPVLGQALQLQLSHPIGHTDFQPVITGNDVHIVPVGEREYWIGATVEFPDDKGEVVAESELLEQVRQEAITFCPALATATIVRTWSGKRPRPEGRPAPVIGQLPGYSNVLLATGHYRNGILLAPATAQIIREAIIES
ncbi:MAG: FAD-binding oxidoreductase [Symploca sp. SIO1A3]|nr:FAD-binding oxidoreductase [Symploca sp. SIO2C1]NER51014.1 FAD-binding oxidoreductase [Symploca sp. SIO1A3]